MINVTLWRGSGLVKKMTLSLQLETWEDLVNPPLCANIENCASQTKFKLRCKEVLKTSKWIGDRYETICYLEELVARNCITLTATNGNHPLKLQNEEWRPSWPPGASKIILLESHSKEISFQELWSLWNLAWKKVTSKKDVKQFKFVIAHIVSDHGKSWKWFITISN